MGEVYSEGVLNIAATSTNNAKEGYFTDRNPLLIQTCLVNAKWTTNGARFDGIYRVFVPESSEHVEMAPLNERG